MSAEFESAARLAALKSGIESRTGETYADLTEGVQALMDGYGQDGDGSTDDVIIRIPYFSGERLLTNDAHIKLNNDKVYNNVFDGYPYLNNIVVDFSDVDMTKLNTYTQNQYWFRNTTSGYGINLTLKGGKNPYFWAGMGCFGASSLKTITGAKIKVGAWVNQTANAFYGAAKLENVEFYENHMVNNWFLQWCGAFNDGTVVSVANALKAGMYTLTLHATPKARCDAILGTVSQKTAEDGTTYDFFTADEAGTVTLSEFVTVTKGWTLA